MVERIEEWAMWITNRIIIPVLGDNWAFKYGVILFVLFVTLLTLSITFIVLTVKRGRRLSSATVQCSNMSLELDKAKSIAIEESNKAMELLKENKSLKAKLTRQEKRKTKKSST